MFKKGNQFAKGNPPNKTSFKNGDTPPKHKDGCRCFRCSHIPWNKGKKLNKKYRVKLSLAHIGQTSWNKGKSSWIKGKHHSLKTKRKISEGRIGNKYSWKGGRTIATEGYVLIYNPAHPHKQISKYVLEHRLVMEKHLGRYLTPKEIVHHINGIPDDNRPENLMLFKNSKEHTRFHLSNKP
jgi:uncharacterized protein (DUF1330 family)